MTTAATPLLTALDLRKTYAGGSARVAALRGVDLTISPGEFVALMGPSGCGKSTLLHLCGAMDRPSAGRLALGDQDLAALDDDALTRVRRTRIGFVFQFFNLLPTLTVAENIGLPLMLGGARAAAAHARAATLAGRVGLAHRTGHYPQQLSGGEMQRTAIARAVVHGPALLVADEPTGNLDSVNGAQVMALLRELNESLGVSILMATHAPDVAEAAHRVLHMRDGRLVDEGSAPAAAAPARAH
jgi:putative ABC transport system ATP-binding protein